MKIRCLFLWLICMAGHTVFGQESNLIPFRKGNLWGYADAQGKVIIEPKYDRTYFFSSDGLARIKSKNLYGYIDRQGKMVIIPKYTSATDYYMGIAEVEQNKKKFCINLEGDPDECNPVEDDEAADEEEANYFTVEKDKAGKYMLIINATEDTVKERYDQIQIVKRYFFPSTNYFAIVSTKGLKGTYNEQGIRVAPVEYQKLDILDMDSYKATKNNRWGVRNFQGNVVIPFEYDSITKVTEMLFLEDHLQKNDHYIVGKNKKFGVLDSNSKTILPVQFDEIQIPKPCSCPTEYVVKQNGLYGLTDFKGNFIIPAKYTALSPFNSANVTIVKNAQGKEGYIDRSGKEFFID